MMHGPINIRNISLLFFILLYNIYSYLFPIKESKMLEGLVYSLNNEPIYKRHVNFLLTDM